LPVAARQSGCDGRDATGPVSFLVTASLTAAAHLPAYRVCGGVGSSAPIPDLPVFTGNGIFDLEAGLKATSVNPLHAVEIAENVVAAI
jgi:hypothetical protein